MKDHKKFSQEEIKSSFLAHKKQAKKVSSFVLIPLLPLVFDMLQAGPEWLRSVTMIKYSFLTFAVFGFIAFNWPYACDKCGKPVSLIRRTCPACGIPLKKEMSPFIKVTQIIALGVFCLSIFFMMFQGRILAFGFKNMDRVKKGLESSVANYNKIYEKVREKGEEKVLKDLKIAEDYDSSKWTRVGIVKMKENSTEQILHLVYNFDSEIGVEDFIKNPQTVKCLNMKENKVACVPVAYYTDEASFKKANSVERSKEYMDQMFAKAAE